MVKDALLFGSYLTRRIAQERDSQRDYRESPSEDANWGFRGMRYGIPFLKAEGIKYTDKRDIPITPVERFIRDRINFLLTEQETVTVMDYGAAGAESLKYLSKLFKGDKRVIFFATSLSQTPSEIFLDGLSPENPEVHYISGDIDDVLQNQTQTLADGREVSLKHGVDIFISDNAISHSRIPGVVFSKIPLLLHERSIAIIENKLDAYLWDRGGFDRENKGEVKRARKKEWGYGIGNLERQGFCLLMPDPEAYNYLVFVGQKVGRLTLPGKHTDRL